MLPLQGAFPQASQREAQKTAQLRATVDEARRLQAAVQRCNEEVECLGAENIKLTRELEDSARKHLEDMSESLAENQKLRLELESSKVQCERLLTEIHLMKETERRHTEALRRSRDDISSLSNQVQDLTRHADTTQVRRAFGKGSSSKLVQPCGD